jgi:hypothetical protein
MNWMMAEGIIHGTTSTPSRVHVAKWVDAAMAEMKEKGDNIRNAWTRNRFEWFVDDTVEQAGGKDGGKDGGCHDEAGEQAVVEGVGFLDNAGEQAAGGDAEAYEGVI